MVAYLFSMPSGFPGSITRRADSKTEPVVLATTLPVGSVIQLDSQGRGVGPVNGSAKVYGFLVRAYPTSNENDAMGRVTMPAGTVQDVLRAGYMSIQLSDAESVKPVKGMPVKVVFTAASGFAVGDYAISQGVEIPGCIFMGEPDGSGTVEISFNV